jgi:hypothetical protein
MRSSCCVCVSVYRLIVAMARFGKNPPILARQRLGRNVTAVTNTHETIELLDASFSMWSVSYQGNYPITSSQNFLLVWGGGVLENPLILKILK